MSHHKALFKDTKKGKTSYKAAQFQDIFDAGGSKPKGKQKKPNINLGKDRMLEDKIYLEMLTQTVTKIGGGTGFGFLFVFSTFNYFFQSRSSLKLSRSGEWSWELVKGCRWRCKVRCLGCSRFPEVQGGLLGAGMHSAHFLLDYQPPKSHFWCAFRWRLAMPQKTNNLSSKSVKSQNRHFKVLGWIT